MKRTIEAVLEELLVHVKHNNLLIESNKFEHLDRKVKRKRWPALRAGNMVSEVFERHVACLGFEPSLSEVEKFFSPLEKGKLYHIQLLSLYIQSDARTLEAMVFFGDIGQIVNLEQKGCIYIHEVGKPAPTTTGVL